MNEARIIITNVCNFCCPFCHHEGWSSLSQKHFMPLEKFKTIIKSLKAVGISRITISGGEPFIHKNISDMIIYSKQNGMHCSVVTNGSLLMQHLNVLEKIDVLNYSIHSLDINTYLANSNGVQSLSIALETARFIIHKFPMLDLRINVVIDDFVVNHLEESLTVMDEFKIIKFIEKYPNSDTLVSLSSLKEKISKLGFIEKERLSLRRKTIFQDSKHSILFTRVICGEVQAENYSPLFCIDNGELNISPSCELKICRNSDSIPLYMDELSRNPEKMLETIKDAQRLCYEACISNNNIAR